MNTWLLLQFLIGASVVGLFSWDKFNTPDSYKLSTTRERYRLAALSYYTTMQLIFLILTFLIWAVPAIIPERFLSTGELPKGIIGETPPNLQFEGITQATDWISSRFGTINAPILSALLMTAFLEHVPWLSKIEEHILRYFRKEIGHIPDEVLRWREKLSASTPDISGDAQADIAEEISQDSLLSGWAPQLLHFYDRQYPAQQSFLRVAHLMLALQRLDRDPCFSRVVNEFSELKAARESIQKEYLGVRIEALELAKITKEAAAGFAQESSAFRHCVRSIREKFDRLYDRICEVLAYHLCYCEDTDLERARKLAEWGFTGVEPPVRSLDPHQWAAIGLLLYVSILTVIWTATVALTGRLTITRGLALGTMVSSIYIFGLAMALMPKGRWQVARRRGDGGRPWLSYLLSGLLAVFGAFVISMVTAALIYATDPRTFSLPREISVTWPWFINSFVFAFVIAFLLDNEVPPQRNEIWFRSLESLIAAASMFISSLVVSALFVQMEKTPNLCYAGIIGNCVVPKWYFPTTVAVLTGAIAGFIVPYWYRHRQRGETKDDVSSRRRMIAPADA